MRSIAPRADGIALRHNFTIHEFTIQRLTFTPMRKFIIVSLAFTGLAHASAAPRTDKIIILGNPAGSQTVQVEADGTVGAEYSFNDRGRGDHIIATWKLDSAGVPVAYDGRG